MLGFKLSHASKKGHWCCIYTSENQATICLNNDLSSLVTKPWLELMRTYCQLACGLFGGKSWLESMLTRCQLDHHEQTSMKFESNYNLIFSRKCDWKCNKIWLFYSSLDVPIENMELLMNLAEKNDMIQHNNGRENLHMCELNGVASPKLI